MQSKIVYIYIPSTIILKIGTMNKGKYTYGYTQTHTKKHKEMEECFVSSVKDNLWEIPERSVGVQTLKRAVVSH